MDAGPHAYHCLPMVVANQWGWQVLCPTDVLVTWDGTPEPAGVRVEVDPRYAPAITSRFGHGIVTFSPPWLFRTPTGWDLYVKGPGNRWKANCVPLEGVVETWWLPYTFTLNWKLVEPGTVFFRAGESLAQLVPVPHGTFRDARPESVPSAPNRGPPRPSHAGVDERRRIAATTAPTHKLYRKAESIPDHLVRVPVPPVESSLESGPDDETP